MKKEALEAANFIKQVTNIQPRIALFLGSGFGNFIDRINVTATFCSSEVPHYPISSVQGHAGKLVFGYLQKDTPQSMPLLVFQGRVHFYEIESFEQVVFPIVISHQLGIRKLIITNAAGGINSCFRAGDLMFIQDILSLSVIQLPTIPNDSVLTNQKIMHCFDTEMKHKLLHCASQINIPLPQGTYCWLKGPSYETPAEIEMLKRIGVDAVGMSTVPEMFIAHSLGMEIIGISLISNLAAGISSVKLTHADVIETGTKVSEHFSELMDRFVLSLC